MKKTLIAATSAFALVLGFSGVASAENDRATFSHSNQLAVAVSVQILDQYVTNDFDGHNQTILDDHAFSNGMANGDHTFTHQILNVNGFNQGINGTNQGAISVAVAANFQGN